MVAAAETIARKTLKRKIKRREKTVHVEDKEVRLPDGSTVTLRLFSEAGAIGLMRPTEAGELEFAPLVRKRACFLEADHEPLDMLSISSNRTRSRCWGRTTRYLGTGLRGALGPYPRADG